MRIPFFDAIANSRNILLAGAGGGFDIAAGIPLYLYLRSQGKQVVLANLSFTRLTLTDCTEVHPGCFEVFPESTDIQYFPERLILNWLKQRGDATCMYAFSNEQGVAPLSRCYAHLCQKHAIDTLILVDGGTDSLMFGDEAGVGTIVEDACSILAASSVEVANSYLIANGFGVERHHNLNHHACLENIATLTKHGDYLGALSLTPEMPEGNAYLELVSYLNACRPQRMSIVNNSIASAMQGEFGDYHASDRTHGSEQFINPLMGLFWFFKLQGIASRIQFTSRVEHSQTMNEVAKGFQLYRATSTRRPAKSIPL